ncbi:MAG: SRPBCC domain-containing protein [Phycisphaerales bacterium]
MISFEEDGVWIEMEETIALHHEDVFACFTTSGGLTRWLAVAARIDLRAGGLIVLGWDEHTTRKTTIAILEYDPAGRITWDWQTQQSDTHAPLYWEVQPSLEEGAVVRLRQGPFANNEESLIEMANEVDTWRWYLCNLRSTMEVSHDMRRVRPL